MWDRLSLMFGLFAAFALSLAGCDRSPRTVILADVDEAPRHYEAKKLTFKGRAQSDLVGEHSWTVARQPRGTTHGKRLWMHVVPVTSANWTKADPIPLWISPSSNGEDVSAWLVSLRSLETEAASGTVVDYAGREPGYRTVSGWQKAIEEVSKKHGLVSDPHAPIVTLGPRS